MSSVWIMPIDASRAAVVEDKRVPPQKKVEIILTWEGQAREEKASAEEKSVKREEKRANRYESHQARRVKKCSLKRLALRQRRDERWNMVKKCTPSWHEAFSKSECVWMCKDVQSTSCLELFVRWDVQKAHAFVGRSYATLHHTTPHYTTVLPHYTTHATRTATTPIRLQLEPRITRLQLHDTTLDCTPPQCELQL